MDIVKVGSLEPDRKIQDSVLVYGRGGWQISAIQTVKQGEEEYKGTGKFVQL